jgi:hypothetical protein
VGAAVAAISPPSKPRNRRVADVVTPPDLRRASPAARRTLVCGQRISLAYREVTLAVPWDLYIARPAIFDLQSRAASSCFNSASLPQSLSMLGNCCLIGFESTHPRGGTIGAAPVSDRSHMAKWAKCGAAFARLGGGGFDGTVGSCAFVGLTNRSFMAGWDFAPGVADDGEASCSAQTAVASSAAARVPWASRTAVTPCRGAASSFK